MTETLLARVRDPVRPERLVVLKRVHGVRAVDRGYVKMFVDEARFAVTLRHPNVVEVYESGEDGGQYYIAMEYLHGHDLRRVLRQMAKQRVPIRLSHALSVARAICRGLHYIHERMDSSDRRLPFDHHDLSSENVLVTYSGRVKLVSLGIAKSSVRTSEKRLGLPAYMSPEQARGEPLDRRSDVFCLGILLWEMTTGRWLYRRESEIETLRAVAERDVPLPSTVIDGYPKELEQIAMKALARKREDRWQSAGELGEALNAFAKQRRLDLRPSALSKLMSATFSDEVAAWDAAHLAGMTLGEHLATEGELADLPSVPAAGDMTEKAADVVGLVGDSRGSELKETPIDMPRAVVFDGESFRSLHLVAKRPVVALWAALLLSMWLSFELVSQLLLLVPLLFVLLAILFGEYMGGRLGRSEETGDDNA